MPIARFKLPDGRIARFEVPDGTTPEQAQSMIGGDIDSLIPQENTSSKLMSNIGEGLKSSLTQTGQAMSEPVNSPYAQGMMKIPDAVIRGVGKLGNAFSAPAEAALGAGGGAFATAVEPTIPAQAKFIKSTFFADNPNFDVANITPEKQHELAMQQGASLAGISAMAIPAISRNMPKEKPSLGKLLAGQESGNPDVVPISSPKIAPEQFQSAINQSYETARSSRKPFYDFMKESAKGQEIDVSPAIAPTQQILDEIKSDPFHPARPIASRLQSFVDNYKENPKMPLADAVEMKQDINTFFNPRKFDQGAKSPYFQVGNVLDSQIESAAKINPIFGQAKQLADKNHVDNVALAFTENKLLEPVWKPEDYYAYKSVEKGPASYLPDATRQRASQMLSNIKTPEQLDAVTRTLPPDLAQALRTSLRKQIKSGDTTYRLNELGNVIGEPLKSPKHLFKAIKGQPYSDTEKALLSATKKPSPSLSTQKLAEQLMKLKEGGQK